MVIDSILIFVLSLIFIKLIYYYASVLGLIDIPNLRSSHIDSTPRGAGIGMFMAVYMVLPLFYLTYMLDNYGLFLSILLVFAIGVLDDRTEISFRPKLLILVIASGCVYYCGIVIDDLGTFFGVHIVLGWASLPFTVFAIVGFTNALNFIDGLDGLAGSISLIMFSGFFYVGYLYHDQLMLILAGSFSMAVMAFLIYNWYPASIFMGDSGSLLLGFVISILAIRALAYLPTVNVLFMMMIPVLDALTVMVRRIRNGRSVFMADRCHIHHIMKGFFDGDTRITVLFLAILQFFYTLAGLYLDPQIDGAILLAIFLLIGFSTYRVLNIIISSRGESCVCSMQQAKRIKRDK